MPVIETAVGFKNFRESLRDGQAILAFEESDGISCAGHTLEKCSLAGLLLALEAMRRTPTESRSNTTNYAEGAVILSFQGWSGCDRRQRRGVGDV